MNMYSRCALRVQCPRILFVYLGCSDYVITLCTEGVMTMYSSCLWGVYSNCSNYVF